MQMIPRRKSYEIFNSLFDFSAGAIRNGFYPVAIGGQASPPINIARTSTGSIMTPKQGLEISAVWACVWLIADTIATLPFILSLRQGTDTYGSPAVKNPLYSVLEFSPNAFMTAAEFWQFMIGSHLLWGNAYALIGRNGTGDVISLSSLLPQFTIPYKVQGSSEIRYKYCPSGLLNEPMQDFASSEIFHFKDKSLDGITGLSRIEYARNALGIAKAAELSASDIYRNGMRATGLLTIDKVLKKDQKDQIKESLEKFKSGGDEAAAFMLLEAGMSFQQLSMNPEDAQLLSSREFSVEDIARFFGVPPILIGHSSSTTWGSGIEQLILGFKTLTIRPYIRRIEQACRKQLVKVTDQPTTYLTIDLEDLMAIDAIGMAQLNSSNAQNGILTRNEMRAKKNLKPMPGGDQLTVQSNLVPLEKLGELGSQPTQPVIPAKAAA